MTLREFAALSLVAVISGASVYVITLATGEKIKAINYCDVRGVNCPPREQAPATAELIPLNLCCSYYDGQCDVVTWITQCDPEHEYAVICEWGRTTADGEIECYD